MFNEKKNRIELETIIGIAGLLVIIWGAFSYVRGLHLGNGSPQKAQSQADYSAVGESAQIKTVVETSPSPINTTSSQKLNTPSGPVLPVLPFAAPPFSGASWIYDWGNASISKGVLSFGASTSSTGGDLFLASSTAWKNYAVQANVNWVAGESFGMIARLADGKDFVYCDFGDRTAQIVLRTNGNDSVILQGDTINGGAGTTEKLGVDVYGNDVACMVNGMEVLGATIPGGDPASGGIGVISWDRTPGVSQISINSITATQLTSDTIVVPFPVPAPAPATTPTPTPSGATPTSTATLPVAKLAIPYSESNFANDANWQRTWGAMQIDNSNFLHVGSAADSSGGTTVLANTDNWLNYTANMSVDWLTGETFMVIGRYVDANNYVGCNFIKDPNIPGTVTMQLEKFVNGNQAVLQTGEDSSFSREGNLGIALGLSFKDATVTCSFNGHTISNNGGNSYGVSPIAGGIGFSTWDPKLGNTEIVVKKVGVAANF